jgi:hypothetical protein
MTMNTPDVHSGTVRGQDPSAVISEDANNGANLLGLPCSHSILVENIVKSGHTLRPFLKGHLEELQESLMEFLYARLAAAGISLNGRVHLYLADDNRLVVEGEDGEADDMCRIVSAHPHITRRFQEISRLALLASGLETIQKACETSPAPSSAASAPDRYHLCFKGALSHFFIR